jgi:hypothetical protein
MSSLLEFYWRAYAWISSAPLPLLVLLGGILLVTVPAAANALFAAALAVIRSGLRLFRRDGPARLLHRPLRHTTTQLISLILLLSWAS